MSDSLVTKLTIKAYKDIKLQTLISPPNEFELQVNPQEISINFGIGFDGSKSNSSKKGLTESNSEGAVGGNFTPRVFSGYKVPELQIDTLIDATGVLPAPKGVELVEDDQPSVRPYITLIKKVMYAWQGEEHGPAFLGIEWGKVLPTNSTDGSNPDGIFKCQLDDLGIKYTLFSAKGMPVRAELTFKFTGVEDPEKAAEGYSPDLSHIIEVKFGDNLPKLCKDIYSSPVPITIGILQIARINNLPSIYAIEPGMKLVFPPLKKASR